MMIQNGITNLVSLLDNVMVGSVGTEAMSGVSIVNQFLFVFYLLIFGAVSAAGIFSAQYHGMNDTEGVRHTFRFKMIVSVAASLLAAVFFTVFADTLINSFLHEGSAEGDLLLTLDFGKKYLSIMLVSLLPYSVSQVYASTMRETGDTKLPMIASSAAVLVNLVLNAVLIFGLFGLPALGVVGAAVATVISRFAELSILVINAHKKRDKYPFAIGVYRTLKIPRELFAHITVKGLPIMANELLWAAAITARNGCYATRGLDVVAALNIAVTIGNIFNVIYMAIGSSIAIMVGNQLGAGDINGAKDYARKLLVFSVATSCLMALLLVAVSPFFPMIYNTSESVRHIATYLISVIALVMPLQAFTHSSYFMMRSGGRVLVTILFDSLFMWAIAYPIAFSLSSFTDMNIHLLFLLCQGAELIKVAFGAILIKKVDWAKQVVRKTS
jgi:putative MATE family efflux protein